MFEEYHPDTLIERYLGLPSVAILGGHYCLASDMQALSCDGTEEQSSFRLGARMAASVMRAGGRTQLVLWINDIGVTPERRQEIRENYRLPDNYRRSLEEASLAEEQLVICFESSMRNRASTLLRKLYKRTPERFERVQAHSRGLIRCVGDQRCEVEDDVAKMAYVIAGPCGERLVVKEGPNPKCNLILATLFERVSHSCRPTVLVNVFNELYSYRIALGVHVYRTLLGGPLPIENIFCDGNVYLMDSAVISRGTQCSTATLAKPHWRATRPTQASHCE